MGIQAREGGLVPEVKTPDCAGRGAFDCVSQSKVRRRKKRPQPGRRRPKCGGLFRCSADRQVIGMAKQSANPGIVPRRPGGTIHLALHGALISTFAPSGLTRAGRGLFIVLGQQRPSVDSGEEITPKVTGEIASEVRTFTTKHGW